MKLATLRTASSTRAAVVDGTSLVELNATDVGAFLRQPGWREDAAAALGDASARRHALASADLAPVVTAPTKVVCVGLNYRTHIEEMGRDLPEHPTLFAKFADTLIGARDDIVRPPETEAFDWEVEIAVVIGTQARRAAAAEAEKAIAGFTVLNDITCRDWQFRTREWLQGKNWDRTTPVGPYLVTPEELPGGVRPRLAVNLTVDGETMQSDNTADLLFDPVDLVQYVSTMVRLNPGDLIATGTPGGVGHARDPKHYLLGGETVVAEVEGLGLLENVVLAESAS
ncbi:fumarylacetoacetate hydrolase family protein [Aeromicrobium sp. CTD01-1L150]|uniref:fumarylacetoacetate hydrolase family protein n=1 Tax=Aeromicrobium sp. CTD01-1L150 TaxID=3341830 RepID=UPI0035C04193